MRYYRQPPDYMYIILSHASVHHSEEPRVQERSKFFASSARNCDYAGYPQVLFLPNESSTTFYANIGYSTKLVYDAFFALFLLTVLQRYKSIYEFIVLVGVSQIRKVPKVTDESTITTERCRNLTKSSPAFDEDKPRSRKLRRIAKFSVSCLPKSKRAAKCFLTSPRYLGQILKQRYRKHFLVERFLFQRRIACAHAIAKISRERSRYLNEAIRGIGVCTSHG